MKNWLKVILWCALIFTLSSIPSARIHNDDWLDFVLRKTAHITEYFVLYLLFYFAINKNENTIWNSKNSIYASLFAIAYAISDEFHQSFVPGRGPSPIDVLVDSFGVLIGNIYLWKFFKKTPIKIQKLLTK